MAEISSPRTLATPDAEGLARLAQSAQARPEQYRAVSRVTTVCRGAFVNANYVRNLDPVIIDEPPRLLGTNTAPNPSEQVLAALGSCLAVGYMANATAEGIPLEELKLEVEGDIDISPIWGVGDTPEEKVAGFTAIRVKAYVKGNFTPDQEKRLHERVLRWSPVANTLRNAVPVTAELVKGSD